MPGEPGRTEWARWVGGVAIVAGGLVAGSMPPLSAGSAPLPAQGIEVDYNGDFTFTRIRYGGGGLRGFGRGRSSWAHDYPDGDRNIQTILAEFTSMHPNTEGTNVVDLENPELFRYPVLYISEPGYWRVTQEGALNLRAHLLKGGYLIMDDFEENQWYNMADQVAQALPEGRWFEIDGGHPVFDTFFFVENVYVPHPLVPVIPRYMAMFEDNDPAGRMMILANHNSDLAEYWEWSPTGTFGVDPTNDAYRIGVNEILYGVIH